MHLQVQHFRLEGMQVSAIASNAVANIAVMRMALQVSTTFSGTAFQLEAHASTEVATFAVANTTSVITAFASCQLPQNARAV